MGCRGTLGEHALDLARPSRGAVLSSKAVVGVTVGHKGLSGGVAGRLAITFAVAPGWGERAVVSEVVFQSSFGPQMAPDVSATASR